MSEKKEDCEARTLMALAVGVGFGVLIGAALLASFNPMFQSKEWAAWVQALGSVGAILAAVWVSYRQFEHSRAVQRESFDMLAGTKRQERIEALRSISYLCGTAHQEIKKTFYFLEGEMEQGAGDKLVALAKGRRGVVLSNIDLLRKVPINTFPGVLVSGNLLNIIISSEKVSNILLEIEENGFLREGWYFEFKNIKKSLFFTSLAMNDLVKGFDGSYVLNWDDFEEEFVGEADDEG